jgi:hypothetical protein
MSSDIPQDPKGHYYAPPTQGGKYETQLSELGDGIGRVIIAGIAVELGADAESATRTGLGKIGDLLASTLGSIGNTIDNLPRINQNLQTITRLSTYLPALQQGAVPVMFAPLDARSMTCG